MPFAQHAEQCPEHLSCTVIVGEQGGREVWRSHMSDFVPPEVRINLDYPDLNDRRGLTPKSLRWRLADLEHLEHLGWDAETHRRVAYHAAARGLDTIANLAAKAKSTPPDLRSEAQAKGWDRQLPPGRTV